jgi:hypothetical protein
MLTIFIDNDELLLLLLAFENLDIINKTLHYC